MDGDFRFRFMKRKSANDWLADIMAEKVFPGMPDTVPEGWLTLKEMCRQSGISESAMRVRTSRLLDSGKLQKKRFRIWTGHQLMQTWHFFPKK